MNTNEEDRTEHEDAADAALLPALAELKQACAPERELWSGIAARIQPSARPALQTEIATRASALRGLRVDQAPPHELWPQIESRVVLRRDRRLRAPWLAAAGLAASVLVVLGLQVRRDGPTNSAHAPLRAPAEVIAAIRDERPDPRFMPTAMHPLAPETRALLRANLKIVSSAETQLKRALVADPDAIYLENLLTTAKQQKADLRVVLAERQ